MVGRRVAAGLAGVGRVAAARKARHHSTAAKEHHHHHHQELITSANGPAAEYERRVANGDLIADDHQRKIVMGLERCFKEVTTHPGPPPPPGLLRRLLGGTGGRTPTPTGLYLWGTVGTGKTMLMDLLYDCVDIEKKTRVHFNAFMLDVHTRIHKEKSRVHRVHAADQARYFEPDGTYTIRQRPHDPIAPVAKQVLAEAWFICFDEFQVRRERERERENLFFQFKNSKFFIVLNIRIKYRLI